MAVSATTPGKEFLAVGTRTVDEEGFVVGDLKVIFTGLHSDEGAAVMLRELATAIELTGIRAVCGAA